MNRRRLLAGVTGLAVLRSGAAAAGRVRPSDQGWPSADTWEQLDRVVDGHLIKVEAPIVTQEALHNPYFIGEQAGMTQTSGWVDAWMSKPSAYAVAARTTAHVVAAVNFAREHDLRLVIKGGGHSYLGTSSAPDSLLVWTRAMNRIELHDAFVARGCDGTASQPAVSVEAGAIWMHVYDAVTTRTGRYVQGGGCTTVGVAGLVQSGGFGTFSKNYGTAAGSLLEAEIVTADGAVHIVNACSEPELFWGIKGGGGGSLGIVTRVILKTHDLPDWFGGVFVTIAAASDAAFRRLIGGFIDQYRNRLFNPHWGESVAFRRDNTLAISMISQGLSEQQAQDVWRPFLDWVAGSPRELALVQQSVIRSIPARNWWDAEFRRQHLAASVRTDDRPGVDAGNMWWTGDADQVGWFIHGYEFRLAARVAATAAGEPCRCAVRGKSALERAAALQQGPGRRSCFRGDGGARHGYESGDAGRVRTGNHRRCRTVGVCRHPKSGRGTSRRARDRCGDCGTAETGPGCRCLCIGEQLLPGRLAARVLG